MADHLMSGERAAGAGGPFNVMMRSPEIGDLQQQLGAQVRFHSSLPPKLNEFAIIITGRYWTSHYEWYAHKSLALKAGLKPAIVDALAAGKRPTGMDAEEEVVYSFATELLNTRHVSDATFKTMVAKFGEKGAVDLTSVIGYYQLVCSMLNLDGYPLPDGAQPELKPLP
jgi:4-carboxymuconolactone decarboxylase